MQNLEQKESEKQHEYFSKVEKKPKEHFKFVPLDIRFYEKPYNFTRCSKIMLFSNLLLDYEEFCNMTYVEKIKLLEKLERSCYNCSIVLANQNNIVCTWSDSSFECLYHNICAKIASNIEKNNLVNNPNIAPKLLKGEIDINKLPYMTSVEMFPQKYLEIKKKIEMSKDITTSVKFSSVYVCRKCKKSQTKFENLYNRSMDEGVNLQIECLNCGHKWNG